MQTADFVSIYQEHTTSVRAAAHSICKNAHTAADITQEAFLRLWKQTGEVHQPRAWLLRVAKNLAKDHEKSHFNRYGTQDYLDYLPAPTAVDMHESMLDELREGLAKLDKADRQVLILFYYRGLSAAQVAKKMSTTPAAVWMRLMKARRKLNQICLQTPRSI